MSFLRANQSIAGVVLADFDSAFRNPFYQSHWDGPAEISAQSIAAAAHVTALALYSLAAGPYSGSLQVDTEALLSTTQELLGCLVNPDPGLECSLASRLISATQKNPEHYLTVLRSPTKDDQDPDPAAKSNLERFLWNFLALRTSVGPGSSQHSGGKAGEDLACDPYKQPCADGSACLGWKFDQGAAAEGQCVCASVRYVPSHSLQFQCQGCDGTETFYNPDWQMTEVADSWQAAHDWPPDPQWTESNWQQLHLRIYQREPDGRERTMLLSGLAVTISSAAVALFAVHAQSKRS